MPRRSKLKPTLAKVFHVLDNFHITNPLPSAHRKGIAIAMILLIIGFLLPSIDNNNDYRGKHHVRSKTDISSIQIPKTTSSINTQQSTSESKSVRPETEIVKPSIASHNNLIDVEQQQWHSYRIEEGKTLAQLFLDHHLPLTDVRAMVIAESNGDGKPVSNLQKDQIVQVRQNASGVVTALIIDTGDDKQVLFTRQQDGSFIRVR